MATITQTTELGPFNAVELRGIGELTFEQTDASATPTLTMEADESVQPKLRREIKDGRLILTWDIRGWEWLTWWFKWVGLADKQVKYVLRAPRLDEILLTGTGKATAAALSGERLSLRISGVGTVALDKVAVGEMSVRVSGSGNVKLAGQAEAQDITISGSGRLDSADLESRRTHIQISGSGSAKVKAADELWVQISGSGRVSYVGEPHQISQRITGAGTIEKAG
jgi:hypothetical protein